MFESGAPFTTTYSVLTPAFLFLPISLYLTNVIARIEFELGQRRQFIYKKKIDFDFVQQKQAQKRSTLLLRNILPTEIINRLHESRSARLVNFFEQATIMFVNITNLSEVTESFDREASEIFNIYNSIFTQFDEVARVHDVEKIKTVNSVYMVASGLPRVSNTHAEEALNLAFELYRIATRFMSPLIRDKLTVRIGIATGPVVAGIIGTKKYSYDCWSDTTNTASRMESNGLIGHVQVTPSTYQLLNRKFHFKKRDKVFMKGKGYMETYILNMGEYVNQL